VSESTQTTGFLQLIIPPKSKPTLEKEDLENQGWIPEN